MWLWLRIQQSKHDTNMFNLPFQPPHNVFILYIKIGNLSVFMKLLSFELPIAFSFEGKKRCSVSFYGPILVFLNNIKKQNHENVYSVQHLQVNI